jgi:erythronate-4-phosphate dehydrogenase
MSALNILADRNIFAVTDRFADLGSVRAIDGRSITANDLQDIDVLLVRSVTQVNEALLQGSPVRFVGTATSGFDHVDRDYLTQSSTGFCHAPGSNANSVVEYVFAAIAAIGDKLEALVEGGSLGIIGYGNIGKLLAARCEALGIRYRVYDPWLQSETVTNGTSLDNVLTCDVISIHAELTRRQPWPSFHLLDVEQLATLGEDTLLINAGRGETIDNQALLQLRQRGEGPLSVLDVWEGEPSMLPGLLESVTLGTAHIAGYSLDGKVLATNMLRDAVAEYFQPGCTETSRGPEPAPIIEVPEGLRGPSLLRWALSSRYEIGVDDALLREAAAGTAVVASMAFDQLRKTYRARRELFGSCLSVAGPEQKQLLAALGCALIDRRESP